MIQQCSIATRCVARGNGALCYLPTIVFSNALSKAPASFRWAMMIGPTRMTTTMPSSSLLDRLLLLLMLVSFGADQLLTLVYRPPGDRKTIQPGHDQQWSFARVSAVQILGISAMSQCQIFFWELQFLKL